MRLMKRENSGHARFFGAAAALLAVCMLLAAWACPAYAAGKYDAEAFSESICGDYIIQRSEEESTALKIFTSFGNLFIDASDCMGTEEGELSIYAYEAGEAKILRMEDEDEAVMRIGWHSNMSNLGQYWPESGEVTVVRFGDDLLIDGGDGCPINGEAKRAGEVPGNLAYGPQKNGGKLGKELCGVWEYSYKGENAILEFKENGFFRFLKENGDEPADYFEGTASLSGGKMTLLAARLGCGTMPYEAEYNFKWKDNGKNAFTLKNDAGETGSIPMYCSKTSVWKKASSDAVLILEEDAEESGKKETAGKSAAGQASAGQNASAKENAGKNAAAKETSGKTSAAAAKRTYTKNDIQNLKSTGIFTRSALRHIFLGEINRDGAGTGYHYEGISDSPGKVIEGTRTKPDGNGVYTGKVEVDGVKKTGNRGYSTFYPESMSPQEVVDAINEAYRRREKISGNLYGGLTDEGIEIDMALTDDGKIITAYPVKED